ncbi:hypothetical protein [Lichenicoccus roseus]|uniref:hypothetical protein n=1 Tax=Lichenicoccus roseus TaxID=2683649 RepID=UPI001106320D|nr:hypothetical protein [Lichenicoccus roseus]
MGVEVTAWGQLIKLLFVYHDFDVSAGGYVHAGNALAQTWHAFISPKAANAQPFQTAQPAPARATPSTPAVTQATGEPKSLTVKVDAAVYASLRAYCYSQEQATGRRVSHQDVKKQALVSLLGASKG